MKQNKSIIESIMNNLARITCVSIAFIIFGNIAYRMPISLSILEGVSIFTLQFYASIFLVVVLLLIFNYGMKRKIGLIKKDEERLKTNVFDALIFLFIGLFLKNMILGGLHYLEIFTNTVPEFKSDVVKGLLEGMKVTNLDKIYNFMTGVVLVPIAEELFFRKGVFAYYADKEPSSRNIVLISGISFGLNHLMGFAKPISAIVTGIVFATIYAITKNIIYPIIGHGLNNLMSSITEIVSGIDVFEDTKAYLEYDSSVGIIGAIIVCAVLLVITVLISYVKRKTILSSDFTNRLKKVFT